jgi:hypothetical protein
LDKASFSPSILPFITTKTVATTMIKDFIAIKTVVVTYEPSSSPSTKTVVVVNSCVPHSEKTKKFFPQMAHVSTLPANIRFSSS